MLGKGSPRVDPAVTREKGSRMTDGHEKAVVCGKLLNCNIWRPTSLCCSPSSSPMGIRSTTRLFRETAIASDNTNHAVCTSLSRSPTRCSKFVTPSGPWLVQPSCHTFREDGTNGMRVRFAQRLRLADMATALRTAEKRREGGGAEGPTCQFRCRSCNNATSVASVHHQRTC